MLASHRWTATADIEPKIAARRGQWYRKLTHSFTVHFRIPAAVPIYKQSLCVECKTIVASWPSAGVCPSGSYDGDPSQIFEPNGRFPLFLRIISGIQLTHQTHSKPWDIGIGACAKSRTWEIFPRADRDCQWDRRCSWRKRGSFGHFAGAFQVVDPQEKDRDARTYRQKGIIPIRKNKKPLGFKQTQPSHTVHRHSLAATHGGVSPNINIASGW